MALFLPDQGRMTTPLRRPAGRQEAIPEPTPPPKIVRTVWYADASLTALRMVSAFMFIEHGLQKHFGLLLPPDQPFAGGPPFFTILWIAGALEIVGGLMLLLGLFTRPVAFILSGFMASAYFTVHAPQGFWPIMNKGELAALYCFVFLALSALGGGRLSLDNFVRHKPRLVLVQ